MIIYNYSKCPIRYYCEEESLLLEFKNLKFVLDFKCSAPDIVSKNDFINEIYESLYSKTIVNGINRCIY